MVQVLTVLSGLITAILFAWAGWCLGIISFHKYVMRKVSQA